MTELRHGKIITRDRVRFKCHIEITEKLLSPELHRDFIRLKRFSVNIH